MLVTGYSPKTGDLTLRGGPGINPRWLPPFPVCFPFQYVPEMSVAKYISYKFGLGKNFREKLLLDIFSRCQINIRHSIMFQKRAWLKFIPKILV